MQFTNSGRGGAQGARFMGRSRGYRGRGRGNVQGGRDTRPRPTHFLALPLHNHPALRSRVAAFQAALFGDDVRSNTNTSGSSRNTVRTSPYVKGLDSSIVIDPVRMHMTLGVMALESEDDGAVVNVHGEGNSSRQRKTVSTALALLASLSPQISQILGNEKGVKVPLEILDVLKTEKMRREIGEDENIGAGVLFLGPRESRRNAMNAERQKLMDVCELINRTFRDAGYLADLRPLKLHCTILNSSHRKPRGWFPFSYSDIRSNKRACDLIRASPIAQEFQVQTGTRPLPPMPVNLGTWKVDEVQLWVMGSRDEEGRYINCGGVRLGGK